MAPPTQPLSSTLPPLICGTATFNSQYNEDPYALPTTQIVQHAFNVGIRAFDTSPYYGPAEELLGSALATPHILANHPRHTYFLLTKVGRVASSSFDYSPAWIRKSVRRSLRRLHTDYLDVVYCHDVEFVTRKEVVTAVRELRHIRDTTSTIKYVGISGYPVSVLSSLAELVLRETGEPLDAVMSYANFTLQNTRLLSEGVPRLRAAGVDVVLNASPLGMGLLRRDGVPIGSMGDFHPAPDGLRMAVQDASKFAESNGERLEVLAIRYALETWLKAGSSVGSRGEPLASEDRTYLNESITGSATSSAPLGVSVMGVSNLEELNETMRLWRSILDGVEERQVKEEGAITPTGAVSDKEWSLGRRMRIQQLAEGIKETLGDWVDYAWESPGEGFVNFPVKQQGATDEGADVNTTFFSALPSPPSETVGSDI